ncbi:MAG: class II aldolase/adducin family protein [Betaproteobacteria bacterium]|nr:class II aldolase/adducin family protein [Betaproteobacteria bacterium]
MATSSAKKSGAKQFAKKPTARASNGPSKALIDDLVAGNRVLAQYGVVDAFGHISVRHDKDPNRYLISCSRAPEIVKADDILEFDLDSNALNNKLGRTLYTERFIHGEIYKRRPDVMAIVHSHSPHIVPFGVAGVPLQAVYHMAGFLCCNIPVFDIRTKFGMTDLLVRNRDHGSDLADILGDAPVALMRGHGNVVVGPSIPGVVYRAIYTEINAKLQQQVRALGGTPTYLSREEGEKATLTNFSAIERPWELWKKAAMAKR